MKKKIFVVIIALIILLESATQTLASSLSSPSNDISDTITNDSTIDENFNENVLNGLISGIQTYKDGEQNTSQITYSAPQNVIASIISFVIIPIPTSINALLSIAVMSDMPTNYPRWFTIESLVSGKFDLFDINFFDTQENNSSVNTIIKQNIAKWFYALRNFAIVASLAVLIYIGILMAISEIASDKAKYKKMLTSWFASFVIIFVIQYILAFAINVSDFLVDVIQNISYGESWNVDKYSQEEEMEIQLLNGDGKNDGLFSAIITNNGWNRVAYAVVYCVLVYYQVKFFFIYLKRFFMIGFLTAVSPLITITYSIDKAGDNQAQAYKNWFKEIMIAIFIQPIHLIFFIIFMKSTADIIARVPILAIILIGTLSRAESIIRKLFKLNGTSLGSLQGKRWQEIMNKKRWNKKRIILCLIIVLLILVLIIGFVINKKNKEKEDLLPYQMTNINDVFKYYNCQFIKKANSKDENLDYDLYVQFDREYYTNDKSNKSYFTSLITDISKILEYSNYSLIDTAKDINIIVMGNKDEKNISKIYYNNDMTYFEKIENENEITNYKKINITNMNIESSELKKIINNNWKSSGVNFGTQESTFNDYNIYFDEGIEVRTTANVIYNIIFTEKYNKTVVDGLKVNDKQDKIKSKLGEPTFYDSRLEILGYKGKDFYIFFSENEVSIYRIEKDYQNEEILGILENFMEEKNKTRFLNSLTDVWNDYDSYIVNDNKILIKYSVKGVEISFTKTGGKITYYKNFDGQISKDVTLTNLNNKDIPQYAKLELTTDLVWESEQSRKDILNCYYDEELINMPTISAYEGENRNIGLHNNEKYYLINNTEKEGCSNIKFVSIDRSNPNSELKANILVYYYGWLDDQNFIYSVKNKGIYKFNVKTSKTSILVEGNEEYKLTGISKETIRYDKEKTIEVK